MARREAYRLRVVGDGKNDNNVAQEAEKAPADKQPKFETFEESLVERIMDSTDGLVPVTHNQAARSVHHKGQDGQNPKGPSQAEIGDHGIGSQRVGKTAKAGSAGGNGIRKRASFGEPLRDHTDSGCKAEAQPEPEAQTLAEEQMPNVGGKRSPDEGYTREIWVSKSRSRVRRGVARSRHSRFEYNTDPQSEGCSKPANEPSSNRRHQQGFPDTVSKDDWCRLLAPGRRWLTY